jgi:hypothetical protein
MTKLSTLSDVSVLDAYQKRIAILDVWPHAVEDELDALIDHLLDSNDGVLDAPARCMAHIIAKLGVVAHLAEGMLASDLLPIIRDAFAERPVRQAKGTVRRAKRRRETVRLPG